MPYSIITGFSATAPLQTQYFTSADDNPKNNLSSQRIAKTNGIRDLFGKGALKNYSGRFFKIGIDYETNIQTPRPLDIVCGRGEIVKGHPGNVNLRNIAIHSPINNQKISKKQKTQIFLVQLQALQLAGIRFLKLNPKTKLFDEIPDFAAFKKVSQATRDNKPASHTNANANANTEINSIHEALMAESTLPQLETDFYPPAHRMGQDERIIIPRNDEGDEFLFTEQAPTTQAPTITPITTAPMDSEYEPLPVNYEGPQTLYPDTSRLIEFSDDLQALADEYEQMQPNSVQTPEHTHPNDSFEPVSLSRIQQQEIASNHEALMPFGQELQQYLPISGLEQSQIHEGTDNTHPLIDSVPHYIAFSLPDTDDGSTTSQLTEPSQWSFAETIKGQDTLTASDEHSKPEPKTTPAKSQALIALPEGYLPTVNDVISKKGKANWDHPGNRFYRTLLRENIQNYLLAPPRDKSSVLNLVLHSIRNNQGNFIKQAPSGQWMALSDKAALEKIGHAFRDQVQLKKMTVRENNTDFL